ncbi:CHAT domain-containing protein [Bradyrhizobium manausense]|nr:CHAT domain-containing protein [Bradyrhizobium manausense]
MNTTIPSRGKAYWAVLGVILPDHLNDEVADKLIVLILSWIDLAWSTRAEIIARLQNMRSTEVAELEFRASAWRASFAKQAELRPKKIGRRVMNIADKYFNACHTTFQSGRYRESALFCEAILAIYGLPFFNAFQELNGSCAKALMSLGIRLAELGDFERAMSRLDFALSLLCAPRQSHRHDRESDPSSLLLNGPIDQSELNSRKAMVLTNRALCCEQFGEVGRAIADYKTALDLVPNSDPRFYRDRARILLSYSSVLRWRRDTSRAIASCEEALSLLQCLANSRELASDQALALRTLGINWEDLDPSRSIEYYSAALDLLNDQHDPHRDLDLECAQTLASRGLAWIKLSQLSNAQADFSGALNLLNEEPLRKRRDLDLGRAIVLTNRAGASQEPTQAIADLNVALALLGELPAENQPEVEHRRVRSLLNRGAMKATLGDSGDALADYISAEALLSDPSGIGGWRHLDPLRIELWVNISQMLGIVQDAQAWAVDRSIRMREMLELAPIGPGTVSMSLNFARFHALWLAHCVKTGNLNDVPQILSALQGRELAARILDELTANEEVGLLSPGVRAYQRARMELRGLATQIEEMVGGGGRGRIDLRLHGSARGMPAATIQERLDQLDAEYGSRYDKLAELRKVAAAEPGYTALLPLLLDAARLVEKGLGHGEALALLLDVEQGSSLHIEGALVLRADRVPQWCPLPGIHQIALRMEATSDELAVEEPTRAHGYSRARIKDSHGASVLTSSSFWSEMQEATTMQLWAPLTDALSGIERVVCVPQGRLHLLPFELGAPNHLRLTHYPGLVFLGYGRGLLGTASEVDRAPGGNRAGDQLCGRLGSDFSDSDLDDTWSDLIGIVGYSGPNDDLPFVTAEIEALTMLHGPRKVRLGDPYRAPENSVFTFLHLACHGRPSGSGPDERVILDLGLDRQVDAAQIMERPLRVRQVLIAACLGGRVREALDGEPSGLVGSYLYRGAREVAASVLALPDDWTMLTSILIHQAWLVSGSLGAAVAEAKRRLASGEWFDSTKSLFVAAAGPVLEAWERGQPLNPLPDLNENRTDRMMRALKDATSANPSVDAVEHARCTFPEGFAKEEANQIEVANFRLDGLHPAIANIIANPVPPQPILKIITIGLRAYGEVEWPVPH